MRLSESVKSISYLKANAADLIEKINKDQMTYVITQNGEAKVIVQDIKVYEQTQEALALLKILAMSGKNLKNKRYKPIDKIFKDVRKKIDKFKRDTN